MHFRRLHRLWAAMFGYFWLPCPLCGREFGGHEWRDRHGKPSSVRYLSILQGWRYRAICPACTLAGLGDK